MKLIIEIILTLFIGACSNPSFKHDTKFPEGQNLYFSKCGGCHKICNRDNYTPLQWEKIMKDMAVRSKLNKNDFELILKYLQER